VVLLVGGPTKSTDFRPLSMDIEKPLFPIGGHPIIYHPIEACCKKLGDKGLNEIVIIGDYNPDVFGSFIKEQTEQFGIKITYIQEEEHLGTAGGLFEFKNVIMQNDTECFFVIHSDVCCSFPFDEILSFHRAHGKVCTIMGTKVAEKIAIKYGCCVVDKKNKQLVHYAEHPEDYISDIINTGVYCFSPSLFDKNPHLILNKEEVNLYDFIVYKQTLSKNPKEISMERELLPMLAVEKEAYVFEYEGFWRSIKNASSAVICNTWLLSICKNDVLAKSQNGYEIVGKVIIHPSAKIAPNAKIGPNVYIGANCVIENGARISNSILLENVRLYQYSFVLYSVISKNTSIGPWSRIEGTPTEPLDLRQAGEDQRYSRFGITVLGSDVVVEPELIIRNCIVLPHKILKFNFNNEVLL